jgi:hypothetical protein
MRPGGENSDAIVQSGGVSPTIAGLQPANFSLMNSPYDTDQHGNIQWAMQSPDDCADNGLAAFQQLPARRQGSEDRRGDGSALQARALSIRSSDTPRRDRRRSVRLEQHAPPSS